MVLFLGLYSFMQIEGFTQVHFFRAPVKHTLQKLFFGHYEGEIKKVHGERLQVSCIYNDSSVFRDLQEGEQRWTNDLKRFIN